MKRIRWVELLAEIKANFVAFFSVEMFVCLGIGLFCGIDWCSTALCNEVQRNFDQGNMYDIELQFPYGITEDDIKQVRAVDGVTATETGYLSDQRMYKGSTVYILRFQSLTDTINVPTVVEGELPKKGDEVALLEFWAAEHGISVGDTIELEHDSTDEDDKDGMSRLTSSSYTVTGLVKSPEYLSKVEGTLGATAIGSGQLDCVAFTTDAAFDTDSFNDGYPVVYISCDDLDGINTFSEEYQKALDPIVTKISDLGEELGSAQYTKVLRESKDAIDDGQKEVDQGSKDLQDARKQIADGESQLIDGQRQLDDAESQIASGQRELSDAEAQLADGRRQIDQSEAELASGEQTLAESRRKIAQGEAELESAQSEAEAQQSEAQAKLDAAKKDLDDAQKKYDASKAEYDASKKEFDEFSNRFGSVSGEYDAALGCYGALQGQQGALGEQLGALSYASEQYAQIMQNPEATEEEKAAALGEVQVAYEAFSATYGPTQGTYQEFVQHGSVVAAAFGTGVDESGLQDLPPFGDPGSAVEAASAAYGDLSMRMGVVAATPVTIGNDSYPLSELRGGLAQTEAKLNAADQQLQASKKELDAGNAAYDAQKREFDQKVEEGDAELAAANWQLQQSKNELNAGVVSYNQAKSELEEAQATYDQKLREYEEAKATFEQKRREFEEGKQNLEQKRIELEDARQEMERSRAELEDARKALEDARAQVEKMEETEWVVMPRRENGGVQNVDTLVDTMSTVRWAMALIFVIIGLFVCYSAISRLVHDEVLQIGAKKALGFRTSEIASLYLFFSGFAVVFGTIFAVFVAVFLVQGIMNPAAAESLVVDDYPPYISAVGLVSTRGVELVLILLSTWFAIKNLLKKNAVDLLSGAQVSRAKTHAWERTKLWQNMPLFSQTIVNNLVNDKRRVVATLIGVLGCTGLIVTALTLSGNVEKSIKRQYEEVYNFDTYVYVDTEKPKAMSSVHTALDDMGVPCAPIHKETLQVKQPDGYRSGTTLIVPTKPDEFNEFYHIVSTANHTVFDAGNLGEGIWVSAAYANHMGLGVGDEVQVTEGSGRTHSFVIDGIFEYYIFHHEFILGREAYREAFGKEAEPNVYMASRGSYDADQVRDRLFGVSGYDMLVDDYTVSTYAFSELAGVLNAVVVIYLVLSVLMAIVVLLNLDKMFVGEKKMELIVLMINGFSVKAAKSYIYRDSVALTVIGIALGVVFGAIMGGITVTALEPVSGHFVSEFNGFAAMVGVVGSAVLSLIMLVWSLRAIPRFELTDINRF